MKVIKKISLLLVIVLFSFVVVSCNKTNKKLGNDTYLRVKHETNENNPNGFVLVIEDLEYTTFKTLTSKKVYRNSKDNDNPYQANVYYRYYDEKSNSYVDEYVGVFKFYSIRYNLTFSISHVIQANEVPSKYELVKGRVYN